MRTVEQQIFEFSELSETAKKKALENHREDFVDMDFIIDDWKDMLQSKYGFQKINIYYTGFGSQGDGACFTFSNVNWKQCITAFEIPISSNLLKFLEDTIELRGVHKGFYYHENSVYMEPYFYEGVLSSEIEDELYEVINQIKENYRNLGKELYRILEQEYFEQISDKYVEESLMLNNYEFYANGEDFTDLSI